MSRGSSHEPRTEEDNIMRVDELEITVLPWSEDH
jgi:hypothetical protein